VGCHKARRAGAAVPIELLIALAVLSANVTAVYVCPTHEALLLL
jgi:hypothetical protein